MFANNVHRKLNYRNNDKDDNSRQLYANVTISDTVIEDVVSEAYHMRWACQIINSAPNVSNFKINV